MVVGEGRRRTSRLRLCDGGPVGGDRCPSWVLHWLIMECEAQCGKLNCGVVKRLVLLLPRI